MGRSCASDKAQLRVTENPLEYSSPYTERVQAHTRSSGGGLCQAMSQVWLDLVIRSFGSMVTTADNQLLI